MSFEDYFAGEAVVIAKDAERLGGEGCELFQVFTEGQCGVPQVQWMVFDCILKPLPAELRIMNTVGAAEGELAGTLPEKVFCGELTEGKIVNRYGGYGGDFGEVE